MTVSRKMSLEIDQEAGAAYLQFSDDFVHRTVDFNDSIAVDLDEHDVVIGVEIIDLTRSVPLDELAERFHIHTEDLATLLQALRSSTTSRHVGSPVARQSPGALRAQTVTTLVPA